MPDPLSWRSRLRHPEGMSTAAAATRPALQVARRRGPALGCITPNWYAAVMGTGIVANAAVTLPGQVRGQRTFAIVVWVLAVVVLVTVTAATAGHWVGHRDVALGHHRSPVMAHFYGAPPMALLTVGAGTLLLGPDLLGERLAVRVDAALWVTGTVLGLVTTIAVPWLVFGRSGTRDRLRADQAFGGWLMPVVPPMVSAATGALLLPHLPAGGPRVAMLLACYAMFGLSLLASLVVIPLVWARLARGDVGPAATVPTLFIVLGPLGQSVTAANLLGGNAHLAVGASCAGALRVAGVVYGLPVLAFAALWAARATVVTVRTARAGLPFALTWWSFTFPVGTCVTGLTALTARTGWPAVGDLADAAYLVLLLAWVLVAARTLHGTLSGALLAPPP